MYFTPKKVKARIYKNYSNKKKKYFPYSFNYYTYSLRSKQFGFLSGRRIEAMRKAIMKFIALKTAKITAKKRASFHKKQRRAESEIRASYIFRRKFLAKKFKISDIRILKIALKRICNLTTPLSKKGILTRMGKGKGKITGWVSWVRPGVSLVEFPNYPLERKQPDLAYLPKNISRIGQGRPRKHNKWIETRMRIAQSKLPFKCKISKLGFSLNYQLKTQIKIL